MGGGSDASDVWNEIRRLRDELQVVRKASGSVDLGQLVAQIEQVREDVVHERVQRREALDNLDHKSEDALRRVEEHETDVAQKLQDGFTYLESQVHGIETQMQERDQKLDQELANARREREEMRVMVNQAQSSPAQSSSAGASASEDRLQALERFSEQLANVPATVLSLTASIHAAEQAREPLQQQLADLQAWRADVKSREPQVSLDSLREELRVDIGRCQGGLEELRASLSQLQGLREAAQNSATVAQMASQPKPDVEGMERALAKTKLEIMDEVQRLIGENKAEIHDAVRSHVEKSQSEGDAQTIDASQLKGNVADANAGGPSRGMHGMSRWKNFVNDHKAELIEPHKVAVQAQVDAHKNDITAQMLEHKEDHKKFIQENLDDHKEEHRAFVEDKMATHKRDLVHHFAQQLQEQKHENEQAMKRQAQMHQEAIVAQVEMIEDVSKKFNTEEVRTKTKDLEKQVGKIQEVHKNTESAVNNHKTWVEEQMAKQKSQDEDRHGALKNNLQSLDKKMSKELARVGDVHNEQLVSTLDDHKVGIERKMQAERAQREDFQKDVLESHDKMERALRKELSSNNDSVESLQNHFQDLMQGHKAESKNTVQAALAELDADIRRELTKMSTEHKSRLTAIQVSADEIKTDLEKQLESERAQRNEHRTMLQLALSELEAQVRRELGVLTEKQQDANSMMKDNIAEERSFLEKSLASERGTRDELKKNVLDLIENLNTELRAELQKRTEANEKRAAKNLSLIEQQKRDFDESLRVALQVLDKELRKVMTEASKEHGVAREGLAERIETLDTAVRLDMVRLDQEALVKMRDTLEEKCSTWISNQSVLVTELEVRLLALIQGDLETVRQAMRMETAERQGNNSRLQEAVRMETAERQGNDSRLQEAMRSEAVERQTNHSRLQEAMRSETVERQTHDSRLQEALGAGMAELRGENGLLQEALHAEAAERRGDHGLLQEALKFETTERADEISKQFVALSVETDERVNGLFVAEERMGLLERSLLEERSLIAATRKALESELWEERTALGSLKEDLARLWQALDTHSHPEISSTREALDSHYRTELGQVASLQVELKRVWQALDSHSHPEPVHHHKVTEEHVVTEQRVVQAPAVYMSAPVVESIIVHEPVPLHMRPASRSSMVVCSGAPMATTVSNPLQSMQSPRSIQSPRMASASALPILPRAGMERRVTVPASLGTRSFSTQVTPRVVTGTPSCSVIRSEVDIITVEDD